MDPRALELQRDKDLSKERTHESSLQALLRWHSVRKDGLSHSCTCVSEGCLGKKPSHCQDNVVTVHGRGLSGQPSCKHAQAGTHVPGSGKKLDESLVCR